MVPVRGILFVVMVLAFTDAAIEVHTKRTSVSNPEEYVNVLGGTQSKQDFSNGNIMPDTTLPWGFNAWAPQTNLDARWWSDRTSTHMCLPCPSTPNDMSHAQVRLVGSLVLWNTLHAPAVTMDGRLRRAAIQWRYHRS